MLRLLLWLLCRLLLLLLVECQQLHKVCQILWQLLLGLLHGPERCLVHSLVHRADVGYSITVRTQEKNTSQPVLRALVKPVPAGRTQKSSICLMGDYQNSSHWARGADG
eukprot:GHRR01017674.1.p1 GENE.GHRR01017674.1~~GHRR01017674.1.p1  ORF type:complete len:109 (-),score=27.28 GHRR01017674.1:390-716(-)